MPSSGNNRTTKSRRQLKRLSAINPSDEPFVDTSILIDEFQEKLRGTIDLYSAQYPRVFYHHMIIQILHRLISDLVREEHLERRLCVYEGKLPEKEHGQYFYLEHRRQWVLIGREDADRLREIHVERNQTT